MSKSSTSLSKKQWIRKYPLFYKGVKICPHPTLRVTIAWLKTEGFYGEGLSPYWSDTHISHHCFKKEKRRGPSWVCVLLYFCPPLASSLYAFFVQILTVKAGGRAPHLPTPPAPAPVFSTGLQGAYERPRHLQEEGLGAQVWVHRTLSSLDCDPRKRLLTYTTVSGDGQVLTDWPLRIS